MVTAPVPHSPDSGSRAQWARGDARAPGDAGWGSRGSEASASTRRTPQLRAVERQWPRGRSPTSKTAPRPPPAGHNCFSPVAFLPPPRPPAQRALIPAEARAGRRGVLLRWECGKGGPRSPPLAGEFNGILNAEAPPSNYLRTKGRPPGVGSWTLGELGEGRGRRCIGKRKRLQFL